MLNLKSIPNAVLLERTRSLAAEERKLSTEILWHLHEIESRRLYAEQGYASLFEYAVKVLGYSEGAAGRRVAAMRLLAEVPEAETKLTEGALSLSTLTSVHYTLKNRGASREVKREILQSLEGKSRRECDRILAKIAPQPIREERERQLTPEITEIRFNADAELLAKLDRLRQLDSHTNPDTSYLELFHRLADLALKRLDPDQTKTRFTSPAKLEPKSSKSASRYISASIKKSVWKRDGGRCSYIAPDGTQCTSRHLLEYDHVTPVATGGQSTIDNLRLRCRTHNLHGAIQVFGSRVMKRYLRA